MRPATEAAAHCSSICGMRFLTWNFWALRWSCLDVFSSITLSVILDRNRKESRAFFVFGFAKNQQSNIGDEERAAFKQAAQHILSLSDEHLDAMIEKGQFLEVDDNG